MEMRVAPSEQTPPNSPFEALPWRIFIDSCTVQTMRRYGEFMLLRTYTAQVEALARLRRGGEQRVIVQHVNVNEGGQAIVGAVNHPGGSEK